MDYSVNKEMPGKRSVKRAYFIESFRQLKKVPVPTAGTLLQGAVLFTGFIFWVSPQGRVACPAGSLVVELVAVVAGREC